MKQGMLRAASLCTLLGLNCLFLGGCNTRQDEKAVEEVTNVTEKNVEKDFNELGEETTKSIEEDGKTNESQLTNPKDLMEVEEDMADAD